MGRAGPLRNRVGSVSGLVGVGLAVAARVAERADAFVGKVGAALGSPPLRCHSGSDRTDENKDDEEYEEHWHAPRNQPRGPGGLSPRWAAIKAVTTPVMMASPMAKYVQEKVI